MKVAALFSGGKDSVYSLYRAIQEHRDVKVLIALKSKNPASYMFHIPNIDLVKLQARAVGLPLIFKKTPGIKEKELKDLRAAIVQAKKKYKIEGIISGALASEYQRYRIETVCVDLGLRNISPIWHVNPERYLRDLLKAGFKVIITAVAAAGFNPSWLGRIIDEQCIEDLKVLHARTGVHLAGEGGEYETLVLDCPIFKRKIEILESEKIMETPYAGTFKIKKAKLVSKT